MQIEHIEQKGIFGQAAISGGQENPVVEKEKNKQVRQAVAVTSSAPVTQTVTYQKPEQEPETVFQEIKNNACGKDAVQMKNEMLVGADTSSPESVQEMEKDGFSLPDTDIHTVVTETDKIRLQLAKAGKDTGYFTGDLSAEQIAQITGSAGLAAQYERAFEQAEAIKPLSEGALKYMLENDLEPTISNLYRAQFNGVYSHVAGSEEIPDQPRLTQQMEKVLASAGLSLSQENLNACKWLAANEISVTPGNVSSLLALQKLQIPFDRENLMSAMQTAVLEDRTPADACLIDSASLLARAEEAMQVLDSTTDQELAYVLGQGQELTIENLKEAHNLITSGLVSEELTGAENEQEVFSKNGLSLLEARRMLEETRLSMTTEANYSLLRRGMEIEIRPLVELVEDLKLQEQGYYRQLLAADGSEVTGDQVRLFRDTIEIADQLKTMPAYALGSSLYDGTLQSLYTEGARLQADQKAAGEAYETLMTAPRADLGDSIQKAFRNVDDILQEIGMEQTRSNARAVRILAYNRMEINEQSVLSMKLADQEVQKAFDSLKPAVVREMIREGINPLHMQMSELNEQADQIRQQIGGADDLTKFSEYLWKLEQKHDLTPEERDSFIGIYRLIHQVEAGDGAAIGALVEQGAPITMGNLLRAVRSEKKSGMDYQVDEDFGGVEGTIKGASITDQINAAYQTACMQAVQQLAKEPEQFAELLSNEDWKEQTPEQLMEKLQQLPVNTDDTAYREEILRDLRTASTAQNTVYEMLEQYDVPATVNHVLAMQQMMANPNDALRRFFGLTDQVESAYEQYAAVQGTDDRKAGLMSEIAEIKEMLLHKLGENIQTPEELAKAQEALAEVAEHCGQTVMHEGMTRLDVRQFQMMSAQLHLCADMVKEERYQIPILTSEGAVGVQLRIVRGEKKGSVRITMADSAYGKVAAEFRAEEKGIRGYLASDSREATDRLQRELPRVEQLLSELTGEDANNEVRAIFSEHLDLVHFELSGKKSEQPENEADRQIQTKELYGIAEKMILFFKEGLTKDV